MRKIAAAAGMACLMAAAFPYCALGAQTGEQAKQQENSEYSIPGTWRTVPFWRKAGCFRTGAGIIWTRMDIRRLDGIKSRENGIILARTQDGWP